MNAARKRDQLAQFLAGHAERRVQIDGFTDSMGLVQPRSLAVACRCRQGFADGARHRFVADWKPRLRVQKNRRIEVIRTHPPAALM
jgi:hypothetical protein